MVMWHRTIVELQLLFERLGAFRDLRTWQLVTNEQTDKVQLIPGLHLVQGQHQGRSPEELLEPSGRRLILVVSDCVSPAWYDGTLSKVIVDWGRSCPLAVIQVLPRRLWSRSMLGDTVDGDARIAARTSKSITGL